MSANEILTAKYEDWRRRVDAKCGRYGLPQYLGVDIMQDVLCVLVLKKSPDQIRELATERTANCTLLDIYVARTIRNITMNRARSYYRSQKKNGVIRHNTTPIINHLKPLQQWTLT